MNGDSVERNQTYEWARRHGLHDPYDFAIMYEDYWGDKERLIELARQWMRDHLLNRKKRIEEQIDELRRNLVLIESGLERVDEYVYD
jgi:hypothetical protein